MSIGQTKATLFSLFRSREPPSLLTVVLRTSHQSDAYRDAPPRALRLHLLSRMVALETDADKSLDTGQGRCKKEIEKNVRKLPTLKGSQLFYVSKPPRSVLACQADKFAAAS